MRQTREKQEADRKEEEEDRSHTGDRQEADRR
jgi:hypothetical protein